MQLVIAHLYYDLLNLYGENGNIKALKKHLEDQDIKVVIKQLSLDDELDFNNYDLVYIGMGTENNQKLALKHLIKYKDQVNEAIEKGKFFLITGNAIELFGKHIIDIEGKKYKGLNIFGYQAKETTERLADEIIFETPLIGNKIIGFQNQRSTMTNTKDYLFNVIKGIGSYPSSQTEGIHYQNFYGTYVIGPILIRNPEFLEYFIKALVSSKDSNFKFKKFNVKYDSLAYQNFVENLQK
jgi:CobQ-like glutamine amidotransferase family enzyme